MALHVSPQETDVDAAERGGKESEEVGAVMICFGFSRERTFTKDRKRDQQEQ